MEFEILICFPVWDDSVVSKNNILIMRRNEREKSDDVQCKFTKTCENSM